MSKAIAGAAELAGAVGLGAAMALDPLAMVNPFTIHLMEALVIGGISQEAGAIADALTQNRGMGITTRQPASLRQIIYGEQRVPGVIVYRSTTGSKKDQYNFVIVLAGHQVDSIVNLYLDGRQVYWTGSGVGNTTRNGVNFGGNADSNTHIGPGGQHYNFGGLVYCEARYGDQQAGDVITGLTANDPNWATSASGTPYLGGCTYVYLKLEYNTGMFPNEPTIRFTVRGKNNIFDPRLAAPVASVFLQSPTVLLNGWGSNGHVGPYEEGVDQAYGWGLNSGTTLAYTNANLACDNNLTTFASCIQQHTHQYAGCVWSFAALTAPGNLTANVSSTGGNLAAATYYYEVTANVSGVDTQPSAEISATTTGNASTVSLSWSSVTGATSYKVYRGTTSGGENVYFTSSSTTFTDTGNTAVSGTPPPIYLNINSSVPPINGALRSAGIYYSLDNANSWNKVYDQPYRAQQWDSIQLSPTQNCANVQVMAFLDSHDDMNQNVYEIQLATGPQTNTTQYGYTTNWALIVADVLTDTQFGLGDVGSVNQDQLIAAANVCDEQVQLANGNVEARYCCHWHYDTGTSPGDVLQTMMPAAMGRISRIGGEWYVFPAYWTAPSVNLDASAFSGKVQSKPTRQMRDLFNRVRGTYIAANYPYNDAGDLYDSNGWYNGTIQNNFPFAFQPTNYPEYACDQLHGFSSDVFLAQDNNIVLTQQLNQNCCLSVTQSQRCAKIALMRNRQQMTATLPMNLWAWQMQPIDVMTLTFAQAGWINKQFEVTGTQLTLDVDANGVPEVRFQVQVQETDISVYQWSTVEELSPYDVPANGNINAPYTIDPPTGLTLVSNANTAVTQSNGSVTPRIYASWTAPTDVRVTQIQIQYQQSGANTWIDDGTVSVGTTSTYISGVVAGQTYNVQIRSLTATGAYSIWDSASGVTVVAPNSTVNTYTNNPAIDLSQPTANTIQMGNVAVTFGSATVNYAARAFTIPTPNVATWYYVTVTDTTQQGETGPTLTANCQTSTALVGVQGYTYIGAINAVPTGNATQILAGGWPAPQTWQVGS